MRARTRLRIGREVTTGVITAPNAAVDALDNRQEGLVAYGHRRFAGYSCFMFLISFFLRHLSLMCPKRNLERP